MTAALDRSILGPCSGTRHPISRKRGVEGRRCPHLGSRSAPHRSARAASSTVPSSQSQLKAHLLVAAIVLLQRVGMGVGRITLWADETRRITLEHREGRFELTLHEDDRVIQTERCESEHRARNKAQGWLSALEVMEGEKLL